MGNVRFDFSTKNVVVTGGAQGIGFQITKCFLESGANVAVWDDSQEGLEQARKELDKFNDHVHFQQVNVADRASCQKAVDELPWSLNILVNNAGITRDKSFAKMTDEDFDAVVDTNLKGVYNVTKKCFGKFEGENLRIINLASVVALYGNFGQTNYVAAKSGVVGMTKTWARELGRKGYTVNAIAPGFTRTKMVAAMPTEILESMANKVPVARLGTTDDIAKACLFLASEEASYINGTVLSVDGGLVV